jgi:hypothetical protein
MRGIAAGALFLLFIAPGAGLAKPPPAKAPAKAPASKAPASKAPAAKAPAAKSAAPTDAVGLLGQGKKLMGARQYAKACPMIADSQRLSPQPSTLLQLGLCHEKEGKIATAFGEFNTILLQTRAVDPSAKEATKHIAALGPTVPKLTISVPPGSANTGLQVSLDGLPVAESAWGLPNPIDPGSHQVSAVVKGKAPWSATVNITKPGEQKTVEVPPIGAPPETETPEAIAKKETKLEDPFSEEKDKAGKEEAKEEPKRESRPFMGYVLLGVGLVGTGVGSYYGVHAIQLRKDSDTFCKPGCTQRGVDLNNQAKSAAWISNIGIGVGAVGIVVGGYMLLKKPALVFPSDEPSQVTLHVVPEISPTTAGLSVGGAW